MPKKSKMSVAITMIIISILAVAGIKYFMGSSKGSLINSGQAKIRGEQDAPIKITEFIDFQCPACANGSKYIKGMMEQYPALIRLQLKHFPLAMHKFGVLSSQYAECSAEQGKFWDMHDMLLARQNNWKRLADARPAFDIMAIEANINKGALNECIDSGRAMKVINKNKAEGNSRNIRSTPTYIVNGKMVVGQKSLAMEINNHLGENGN